MSLMARPLTIILQLLSRGVLRRYRPRVVAVTGSVGKTSTRLAIAQALRPLGYVGQPTGNYNNEIGVPLAILRSRSGNRSAVAWIGILWRGVGLLLFRREYPQTVVLEFGADRPGDIRTLAKMVRPTVGVVTAVGEAHLEEFGDLDGVANEKGELVRWLPSGGWAVLNHDDERVWAMRSRTTAQVTSYGMSAEADVRVESWQLAERGGELGTLVKLAADGHSVPIFVPGGLGRQYAYVCAAAAAVARVLGVNLVDVGRELAGFMPAPGRMRVLGGLGETILVDDTYNASPPATRAAIDVLSDLKGQGLAKRTVLVLGSMLELGRASGELHAEVGRYAVERGTDVVVTVGDLAADVSRAAAEAGGADVRHFTSAADAVASVRPLLEPGVAVLVKGSQGARMERVSAQLLAEPERAAELLVRQTPYWLRRP